MAAPDKHVVVIGGGAAGFFAAINCAQKNPDYKVTILEKSSTVLNKVKVSGGGRCNVTNATFNPHELVKNYPRGEKQLLGPFTRFNPSHTIDWFREYGVEIKREGDGRMFPSTDSSQTIIDCFLQQATQLGIHIKMQCGVDQFSVEDSKFKIYSSAVGLIVADSIIVTTGSSHSVWKVLEKAGHNIVPPVASLFTFNIRDERINGLQGLSVDSATVHLLSNSKFTIQNSALLITHWGLSGPAILKLSALAARELANLNYKFDVEVNWCGRSFNEVKDTLYLFKKNNAKKNVGANPLFGLPKRLWERIISYQLSNTGNAQNVRSINTNPNYADLSNAKIESIASVLTASLFRVNGKSTFKDEFVTAGGVDLREVDFKTMQSKKIPGLYFAGEVLDIDAITGGFNFQAAWTTAWLAAQSV